MFGLLLIVASTPARAATLADIPGPVSDAAMRLVRYCSDFKAGLDEQAVATLVDFVLTSKDGSEYALPKSNECVGAYYDFHTQTAFPRLVEYTYSSSVPAVIARPSSLRYSIWTNPGNDMQRMPRKWSAIPPKGAPVVIRGRQHESNTPDLNTGVYYDYELESTLILLNHDGRQVFISISKQVDKSSVGKKGVILGNDNDWTYFYSNEPGTMKSGLGWAKSYIYDYFSVVVYVESDGSPAMVSTAMFQWLRAGWMGINFVKPGDILGGLKRFATSFKTVLESPRLPAPSQLASVYRSLSNMPASDLTREYAALQQAVRSLAVETGKISESGADKNRSRVYTSRKQMVQELMLEYLKTALGKPTPLEKRFFQSSAATSQ